MTAKQYDSKQQPEEGKSFRYPTSIRWGKNDSVGFHYFTADNLREAHTYCRLHWSWEENAKHLQVFKQGKWCFASALPSG